MGVKGRKSNGGEKAERIKIERKARKKTDISREGKESENRAEEKRLDH